MERLLGQSYTLTDKLSRKRDQFFFQQLQRIQSLLTVRPIGVVREGPGSTVRARFQCTRPHVFFASPVDFELGERRPIFASS